jgi:hypothetical protein
LQHPKLIITQVIDNYGYHKKDDTFDDLMANFDSLGRFPLTLAGLARTVKLLNETQNISASDLSDRKISITLEPGPFSLDI